MCGRFVSSTSPDDIAAYFDAVPSEFDAPIPSWNVAPTDDVQVVVDDRDERVVRPHRWGLVPFWAKDPSIGSRMINARADGLATSNAFKKSFGRRRCIVPADGFYEWRQIPGRKAKQPYFIHRADGELLAFAGLWADWKDRRVAPGTDPGRLRSTTIVTTEANETMQPVHDRMPVILPPTAWDRWLDPDLIDVNRLTDLLVPAPPKLLVMHPVSAAVGNVRNQGPELIEPVPALGTDPTGPVGEGPADPVGARFHHDQLFPT